MLSGSSSAKRTMPECKLDGCTKPVKTKRNKYCSRKCQYSSYRTPGAASRLNKVWEPPVVVVCKFCGRQHLVPQHLLVRGKGLYCNKFCRDGQPPTVMQWKESTAYLVGLIASDGCITNRKNYIYFSSIDHEQVERFRDIVSVEFTKKTAAIHYNKIWHCTVNSRYLYDICINIGITPSKSKTIQSLSTGRHHFSHFLRGYIDGNGSISCGKIMIYSGSHGFLEWLLQKCTELYGVGGSISSNKGAFRLSWSYADSLRIGQAIYKDATYFLQRKKDAYGQILNT